MDKKRKISPEEIALTKNNTHNQRKLLAILHHNRKKLCWDLDNLQFLRDAYEEKVKDCDRQIQIANQTISDGEKFLQRTEHE